MRQGNICTNLSAVKYLARDQLQFHKTPVTSNRSCTLMLLSNLREPDWISVSCDKKLLNAIICKIQDKTQTQ